MGSRIDYIPVNTKLLNNIESDIIIRLRYIDFTSFRSVVVWVVLN